MGGIEKSFTGSTIKNRIEGLDLIRAAAIVFVVLNHTVEVVYGLHDVDVVNRLSTGAQWLALIGFTLGRCGVPLFFFLSGYLLLPRAFDQQSTTKFYRRNVLNLLATWECWIVIYNLIIAAFEGMELNQETAFMLVPHAFDPIELLRAMVFIDAVDMMHAWYVGVILGIYLFVPFVARVLPSITDKQLSALMTISFAYCFILPTVARFTDVELKPWIDLSFSGGLYGLYVVTGYILRRFEPTIDRTLKSIALIPSTLGLIILIAYVQLNVYHNGGMFLIWYDFCLLPLAAIGLFIAIKRISARSRLIEMLSRFSFGIYLLHAPILILMVKYDVLSTLGRSAKAFCWLIAIVAMCCLTVKAFGVVQRFLFRVK